MANRLSIFEFVSNKNIKNSLLEASRDFELMEAVSRINTETTARQQLPVQMKKIQDIIDAGQKVNYSFMVAPAFIAMQRWSPYVPEMAAKVKELTSAVASMYPEEFPGQDLSKEDAFNQANAVNRNTMQATQTGYIDPDMPTTTIDAPLANMASRRKDFQNALGLDNIKNTFGSPDANKINVPVRRT